MMEMAEILHHFERAAGKFPREAVEAAVARREEITPELLGVLEDTLDRAAQLEDEDNYMAHMYAMFLLAQFRETRAYPLVVRFALLSDELQHSLCGEFITENLGQVLASVCGGDMGAIQSLIENDDATQWARSAALSGLLTLVATGQKSREEIVSYQAYLFRGKLVRQPSSVWDLLVSTSTSLYPAELIGDIEQAYKEGLVDSFIVPWADVQHYLANGKDWVLATLADDPHCRPVENTVEEMEWWPCFQERRETPMESEAQTVGKPFPKFAPPPAPVPQPTAALAPIRNTKPKVGRNELCPCGSGKKYKKCCGA
jgi:hypothetical protein